MDDDACDVVIGRKLLMRADDMLGVECERTLDEEIAAYLAIHDEWRLSCSMPAGVADGW